MTQPAVTMTEVDGALGILPPTSGALLAVVGTSSIGTADTPAAYAKVSDIVAAFGRGPLVEAAAYAITKFGRPVLCVKTGNTTAGTLTSAVLTGTGTATVDVSGSPLPIDDREFHIEVITGGILGTAGIEFKHSQDGGRTQSATTALGTAITFEFEGSGASAATEVELTFGIATETLVAGDIITFRSTAPMWNTTEIGTALTALRKCAQLWSIAEIVGAMDATLFAAVESAVAAMPAYGKDRMYIGHARIPDVGESEATYLTSLTTIYGSLSTVYGSVCAGTAKMISGVSGRQYKRPPSWHVAPMHAVESEEVNLGAVNIGRLVGVILTDSNGNPDDHDESSNPGLDDARFLTLRTWEGRPGVFINRPRMLSISTSDYQLIPHRRVMNLAKTVIRSYLEERVNEEILVDSDTGYILEEEALEIEAGANAALSGALLDKPKASGASFVLSRTDNLLSTKTMNCTVRIVPLAYPEFISVEIGFENPAIQARGV
ncbi:MAG: hypothetical protein GY700_13520 [Propionibacteriaceae bacterium]|nr:hypothetical protein [Propionibacteriaceae bacterium]